MYQKRHWPADRSRSGRIRRLMWAPPRGIRGKLGVLCACPMPPRGGNELFASTAWNGERASVKIASYVIFVVEVGSQAVDGFVSSQGFDVLRELIASLFEHDEPLGRLCVKLIDVVA